MSENVCYDSNGIKHLKSLDFRGSMCDINLYPVAPDENKSYTLCPKCYPEETNRHYASWLEVQLAWTEYLAVYYYNNPNEKFALTKVIYAKGKWYVVRPGSGKKIFIGNDASEAIGSIESSRKAQGVRVSKV